MQITPTYSGCPAMETIRTDLVDALTTAGYQHVAVEFVLAPAWTTDWMTDEARAKLTAYGIAPPGRTRRRAGAAGPDACAARSAAAPTPASRAASAPPPASRCGSAGPAGSRSTTSRRSDDAGATRAAFHPLRVAAIDELTDDAVAVTFDVPADLADDYAFGHGQHLNIRGRRRRPAQLLDLHPAVLAACCGSG